MRIITSDQVSEVLSKAGIPRSQQYLADSDYVMMTEECVVGLGRRFKSFLWKAHIDQWREESGDCDDFSLLAEVLAKLDHRRYDGDNVPAALCFGRAWFIGNEGGHSVNFAIHERDNEELYLCLYEPQITPNPKNTFGEPEVCLAQYPSSNVQLWLFASC